MKKICILLLISFGSFGQDKDSLNFENQKLDVKKRFEYGFMYTRNLIRSNDSTAIINVRRLIKLAEKIEDTNFIGKAIYLNATYDIVFEKNANAIMLLQKAERIFLNISPNHDYLPKVYSAFGQLYLNDDKSKLSISYLEKSISIIKRQEKIDTLDLMRAYHTIGTNYTDLKEWEKSTDSYRIAYELALKLNNEFAISVTGSGLATSLIDLGENFETKYFYEAIKLTEKSNSILSKLDFEANLAYGHSNLGRCFYNLKEYKKSIDEHKNAILLAEKYQIKNLLNTEYQAISRVYSKIGDSNNAFSYLQKHVDLNKELTDKERTKQIDELSTKYETEKKETQIKDLSQQKQISELESKRKNTLIYSILGAILALSAIAYFSFTRFKEKKANELLSTQLQEAERRIEIEQKATESELKALKSQMNPHFMFNALNGIQEQFMYGDKTVANEQMGNFTYLTRQILTVSGKKKINLSTEIEILTKYLELEKMRFAEGFNYEINLSENIDEDYHQIPPMLIQPFVENSIKHGLLHKQGDKKVSVYFDLDEKEENLICVVEDNGVGREKSSIIKSKQIQQHESFSTSATEERLRLLGNNLNGKDLVVYEDLKNVNQEVVGTRVVIKIALG
jgi:two-component system, LytTR family, sensor kinase